MNAGGSGSTATIGAYYYPWSSDDAFDGGLSYIRKSLNPAQYPYLGEYDAYDYNTLNQHLSWSAQAKIQLWITSWTGAGDTTDNIIKNKIFPLLYADDLKLGVLYESSSRTQDFSDTSKVFKDIVYLAKNYFTHPNYLKIDDRPAIFISDCPTLASHGLLGQILNYTRQAAAQYYGDVYIVGDLANGVPTSADMDNLALVDAITCYDVAASLNATEYVSGRGVNQFAKDQMSWAKAAYSYGVDFIPAVTPGFNDMARSDDHGPISRKLTTDSSFGSLLRALLEKAFQLMDKNTGYLVLVNSFNRWDQDTQIEPVKVMNGNGYYTNQDQSSSGYQYTYGIEYDEYGTRYLDILQEVTS